MGIFEDKKAEEWASDGSKIKLSNVRDLETNGASDGQVRAVTSENNVQDVVPNLVLISLRK